MNLRSTRESSAADGDPMAVLSQARLRAELHRRTSAEVAREVGLSRATLLTFVRGATRPQRMTASRIAEWAARLAKAGVE